MRRRQTRTLTHEHDTTACIEAAPISFSVEVLRGASPDQDNSSGGGQVGPYTRAMRYAKKGDTLTYAHDLAKISHPGTPIWTPKWPSTVHLSSKPDPDGAH